MFLLCNSDSSPSMFLVVASLEKNEIAVQQYCWLKRAKYICGVELFVKIFFFPKNMDTRHENDRHILKTKLCSKMRG